MKHVARFVAGSLLTRSTRYE